MRSENDLREAFTTRAADAPDARDVLAAVQAAVREPRRRTARRWLKPLAAAAAVACVGAAIGVPIALRAGGSGASSSSGERAGPATALVPSQGPAPLNNAGSAAGEGGDLCRPDQVTLALRWQGSGGVLTATNHSPAPCDLRVRPVLRAYQASGAQAGVDAPANTEPARGPSQLRPGASATANLSWVGCAPAYVTIRASWGTGEAPVTQQGRLPRSSACAEPSGAGYLSAGWFTGLS